MTTYTKDEARTIISLLIWLIVPPFAISGAFWFSPYLGWPTLVLLGLFWIGTLGQISEFNADVKKRIARREAARGKEAP